MGGGGEIVVATVKSQSSDPDDLSARLPVRSSGDSSRRRAEPQKSPYQPLPQHTHTHIHKSNKIS